MPKIIRQLGLLLAFTLTAEAFAAKLILNEYNAVSSSNYLNGGDEFMDGDGKVPPPADPWFGRVPGNGGDWFELVVVADHLDIRGWKLAISDDGVDQAPLVFTTRPIWSDLRAGTIITVSEEVADDVSYAPQNGDWWINVRAADPGTGGTGVYITAAGFPVTNDDWQLTIYDRSDAVVFGPAGEGIVDDEGVPIDVGVNSEETFLLGGTPSAIVERFSSFYTDGKVSSFGRENELGDDAFQDFSALRLGLPVPDRDGDGIADDGDHSGVAGDHTCSGGDTLGCDDNCPTQQDATQADRGGLGGERPDGIGDECQCGDADDDGTLTSTDVQRIRDGDVVDPDKCSVTGAAECNVADAVALADALRGDPGAISQVCPAAVIPEDNSDFVYDPERVLEVQVSMDPADFDAMRNETQTKEELFSDPDCGTQPFPSPFNWYTADSVTIDGQTIGTIGIRKKGFIGSLSVEKPALKLELDRYVAGQQFNDVTRFTFNNAKEDPSLVRQCLSFAFFERAGIAAPRCNFAHVVVNGEDLGVYANVETIKEPFLARNFPTATGKLWEGTLSDFWPGSWSGTYEPETDAAEDDRHELDAMAAATSTLSGQALLTELALYMDIDQFIDYWAAEAVVGHLDGYARNGNNYFVYIDSDVGLMQFFPWDADYDFNPPVASIFEARMALARKLYNIPHTRDLFLARVQSLLDTAWRGDISLSEIGRMRALLTPVLQAAGMQDELRQMITWQNRLKDWIRAREDDVRTQLAGAPPSVDPRQIPHPCDLYEPPGGHHTSPGPAR
jgi:hypothetical protein